MNFFQHQESARKRTRIMVVLYLLAVMAVILAVDLVIAVAWASMQLEAVDSGTASGWTGALQMVPTPVYVLGALATLAVILGASLVQTLKLSAGGAAVAKMVGARRVKPHSGDLLEQRLMNVVEEMSIASGVRVPAVFVMDGERAINAFAAGNTVSNAAVVVTRGTLEALNRDELQGVIAHEFSHILNGDMALNIRMLGILAGIVFISSIGGYLLRNLRGSDNKGAGGIYAIGLALFIIGYIGLFFARLIKASVSRQREFLADASSVQFTRNPDGIAGALDQIRASGRGTEVDNRFAEDVAHMFFGQGIRVRMGGMFDTHPQIEERMRRVSPGFQHGPYRSRRPLPEAADAGAPLAPDGAVAFATSGAMPSGGRAADIGMAWGRSAADSVALVGSMDAGRMQGAQRQLAALPVGLRERLRDPVGARAALIALLLAPRDAVMSSQIAAARAAGAGAVFDEAAQLAPQVHQLGPAFQLAIVDLALPAVKAATRAQQEELVLALEAVINADRRVSLHEYVMLTLVQSQLVVSPGYPVSRYKKLDEVRDPALLLIGLCAQAGCRPGPQSLEEGAAAFRAGAQALGFEGAAMPGRKMLGLEAVRAALAVLRELAPMPKALLIKGLFATVIADGSIRVIEAALMRMVGAVLDCPLPPLIADAAPGTLVP